MRQENGKQTGIERSAGPVGNEVQRLRAAVGLLVDALADQSVVNIGQRDDLRPDGNVVALQPVG